MIYFLTSSPCLKDGRLNPVNGFVSAIKKALAGKKKALFISSDPDSPDLMHRFGKEIQNSFERSGIYFSSYVILDRTNVKEAKSLISDCDFLILAGGHVPTENKFFFSFGLRRLLKHFTGIVLGISAGSMNAADIVYSQPEKEHEATDKNYQRFFQGLGITKINILPHYNELQGSKLDGMLLYEEITFADSLNHHFYVFPDGTYLSNISGKEIIYGECYLIHDRKMELINKNGQKYFVK